MTIYVDIDETICVTPANRDYAKSTPIKENIKKINDLYNEGHTIIYWTARGSASGKDHSKITQKQMKEWKAIPESTRPTWEQFKRGLKVKRDRVDELNAIDAAETKADLAEYQRQGALDRDGKPIHL